MNASCDEPTIPPRLLRPLAAVWISLGLHAALIALLQVAPPSAVGVDAPAIEVRLVSQLAAPAVTEAPPRPVEPELPPEPQKKVPALAPSETAEATPVARPESIPQEQLAPPAAPAPASAITSSVDLTYYTARDLDMQPRALREIVPEYPADADRQGLSGKVRLQLKLEADGRVSDVEVVSATPPGRFEDSAVRAFRDVRFAPAQKGGRPVRAQVLIEVEYDWEGRR